MSNHHKSTAIADRVGAMARRLRVPVRWLRAEAEAGKVPALSAGGRFLFSPEAVEAVLIGRARKSGEGVRDAK